MWYVLHMVSILSPFSMNPGLDIGQVEGAFVMGLGYWLTEDVKYDVKTGELLTHNTWVRCPACLTRPSRLLLDKN